MTCAERVWRRLLFGVINMHERSIFTARFVAMLCHVNILLVTSLSTSIPQSVLCTVVWSSLPTVCVCSYPVGTGTAHMLLRHYSNTLLNSLRERQTELAMSQYQFSYIEGLRPARSARPSGPVHHYSQSLRDQNMNFPASPSQFSPCTAYTSYTWTCGPHFFMSFLHFRKEADEELLGPWFVNQLYFSQMNILDRYFRHLRKSRKSSWQDFSPLLPLKENLILFFP